MRVVLLPLCSKVGTKVVVVLSHTNTCVRGKLPNGVLGATSKPQPSHELHIYCIHTGSDDATMLHAPHACRYFFRTDGGCWRLCFLNNQPTTRILHREMPNVMQKNVMLSRMVVRVPKFIQGHQPCTAGIHSTWHWQLIQHCREQPGRFTHFRCVAHYEK